MFQARKVVAAGAAIVVAVLAGVAAGRAEGPLVQSAVFQWADLEPQPTRVGFVRHVVRTPTATLDELESHITTLGPGQSPHAPHQHPNEEMIILKEGEVEAYVNGDWVRVETGGMLFFASNVPHTVRNVADRPATYYVVNWTPPGLNQRKAESR